MACATLVCACHGLAPGTCPVCYRGFLSQYYGKKTCGYEGCGCLAVAESPRVKRPCFDHAVKRGGVKMPAVARVIEYAQGAAPTS
jgi:hypothetical protein